MKITKENSKELETNAQEDNIIHNKNSTDFTNEMPKIINRIVEQMEKIMKSKDKKIDEIINSTDFPISKKNMV